MKRTSQNFDGPFVFSFILESWGWPWLWVFHRFISVLCDSGFLVVTDFPNVDDVFSNKIWEIVHYNCQVFLYTVPTLIEQTIVEEVLNKKQFVLGLTTFLEIHNVYQGPFRHLISIHLMIFFREVVDKKWTRNIR
jgi:hypothetical protein